VLSACQTAAGNDDASLGLAGLGIKAVARSAMGSLWSIDDQATARLIESFYSELKKPNTSKAQALRQAQIHMLDSGVYTHPFFWSAFLLINNWL
jgi:CHAT domain-containing protein